MPSFLILFNQVSSTTTIMINHSSQIKSQYMVKTFFKRFNTAEYLMENVNECLRITL